MCFSSERRYAWSLSLKAPSVVGTGVASSTVVFTTAEGTAALGGLKGFQGFDGQWKGLPVKRSAIGVTLGEADGLEMVVSSSEDSSLTADVLGDGGGGVMPSNFLSGLQPGGRRFLSNIWGREYDMMMHSLNVRRGLLL